MKPKPFWELKNLTVPVAISSLLRTHLVVCEPHHPRCGPYPDSACSRRRASAGQFARSAKSRIWHYKHALLHFANFVEPWLYLEMGKACALAIGPHSITGRTAAMG